MSCKTGTLEIFRPGKLSPQRKLVSLFSHSRGLGPNNIVAQLGEERARRSCTSLKMAEATVNTAESQKETSTSLQETDKPPTDGQ